MSKTINSITTRVNQLLQNDYKDETTLNHGATLAASETTITVADGTKFEKGDVIEVSGEPMYIIEAPKLVDYLDETADVAASITAIHVETSANFSANDYIKMDDEYMKVSKVSAIGSDNMKVDRGERGTEAASHYKNSAVYVRDDIKVRRGYQGATATGTADSTAVYIVDGWTKHEIKENIKRELESLYPFVAQNYIGSYKGSANRKQLDDCDAITGWNTSSDATTAATDTSNYAEGTASLKLGAAYSAGTATYTKTIATAVDSSNYEYLNVWVYIKDKFDSNEDPYVDQDVFKIMVGSDTSNYKYYNVGRDAIHEGEWTLLTLNLQDFTSTGTPDMTAIDVLAITINDKQSITSGDIKMDEWSFATYPRSSDMQMKYRLPIGVREVNEVRLYDSESDTTFDDLTNWAVEGEYLYFKTALEGDRPIQIIGTKAFTIPSADTTALTIDDSEEEIVIVGAAKRCIESKLMEILRSDKLSVRYQDSYPLYLDREKRRLTDRYNQLLLRNAQSAFATADFTKATR